MSSPIAEANKEYKSPSDLHDPLAPIKNGLELTNIVQNNILVLTANPDHELNQLYENGEEEQEKQQQANENANVIRQDIIFPIEREENSNVVGENYLNDVNEQKKVERELEQGGEGKLVEINDVNYEYIGQVKVKKVSDIGNGNDNSNGHGMDNGGNGNSIDNSSGNGNYIDQGDKELNEKSNKIILHY